MKDLETTKRILGIENKRDKRRKLLLSKEVYLKRVIHRFRMSNAKLVITPMSQQFKLSVSYSPKVEKKRIYMNNIPYESVVGTFVSAIVCTRLDIAYVVSLVTRFMSNHGRSYWKDFKWILIYIEGYLGRVLVYGGTKNETH